MVLMIDRSGRLSIHPNSLSEAPMHNERLSINHSGRGLPGAGMHRV